MTGLVCSRDPLSLARLLTRFFALLCPRCRVVREPKELPEADRKTLKRWSEAR